MTGKASKFSIFLTILIVISILFILDASISEDQTEANVNIPTNVEEFELPEEVGVFALSGNAIDYKEVAFIESKRSLDEYYANRAYYGAPPVIPHAITDERTMGGKTCLQCHESGGYVAQYQKFAPVTPHPEFLNCRQCHATALTGSLFAGSSFEPADRPQLGQAALVGGPPKIPHGLQLRENCLACHAGPSAPKEIRVSHPERLNCRQCHAAPKTEGGWVRTAKTISE